MPTIRPSSHIIGFYAGRAVECGFLARASIVSGWPVIQE